MWDTKTNYNISIVSTPIYHTQHIASTSSSIFNSNTPTILPPVSKYYMCFQKYGKSDQATRCIKSISITKVIYLVLSIDIFEQKCVILKGLLQSPWLKDHVHTIVIEPSLRNNAIYEHKYLENIKKIYKQAGKCDDQQQFKDILGDTMVSTPGGFIDNSPLSPMTSSPVKKPSAQKSLRMFTNLLDVKKIAYCQVGAAKYKHKVIKFGNTPW